MKISVMQIYDQELNCDIQISLDIKPNGTPRKLLDSTLAESMVGKLEYSKKGISRNL